MGRWFIYRLNFMNLNISCLSLSTHHENQRLKKLNSLRIILTDTPVLTITTDLLLSGSEHLSVDKNTRLFDAVFKFISESKRFGN